MKEISIEITDQGVRIETAGYKDNSCLKEVESLIKSLESSGINVEHIEKKMKPEGYVHASESKVAIRK